MKNTRNERVVAVKSAPLHNEERNMVSDPMLDPMFRVDRKVQAMKTSTAALFIELEILKRDMEMQGRYTQIVKNKQDMIGSVLYNLHRFRQEGWE